MPSIQAKIPMAMRIRHIALALCGFCGIMSANEEFIVSYKALVKNHIVVGEEYNLTKALTISQKWRVVSECSFVAVEDSVRDSINFTQSAESTRDSAMDSVDSVDSATDSTLLAILRNHKDSVLDCLNAINANVRDDTRFINNAVDSSVRFEYKPQRVKAREKGGVIELEFIEKIQ